MIKEQAMETEIHESTFTFTDPEGIEIFVYKWAPTPDIPPNAVVQIAHGAAEHALRYKRVSRFLNAAGYIVYANDHRGHNRTAGTLEQASMAGPDGWNGIVKDVKQLTGIIKEENPGLPVFLFGHSMGSLIVQQYIQEWGKEIKGIILSGTFGVILGLEEIIKLVEQSAEGPGADAPSDIFAAMFASFNEPFAPAKTGFEWLSRDEIEVQKYVDDPWCGFPLTNAMVAGMLKGAREIWQEENEARIPKELPMFVISGDRDPVGGNTESITPLTIRYEGYGIKNIRHKFYANARHELLNEVNRDEVHRDILTWLDDQLG
jgi:alpha-beta hydrolase superfamily lysophospholipase